MALWEIFLVLAFAAAVIAMLRSWPGRGAIDNAGIGLFLLFCTLALVAWVAAASGVLAGLSVRV